MSKKISWRKNQPVIKYIRETLPDIFPVFKDGEGVRKDVHNSGVGGYTYRTVRNSKKMSLHSEGRAADIYLDSKKSNEKVIGDGLFDLFIEHAEELGVQEVMWNKQKWTLGVPEVVDYPERPHLDHVHVAFTRIASQKQPKTLNKYFLGLRTKVNQINTVLR